MLQMIALLLLPPVASALNDSQCFLQISALGSFNPPEGAIVSPKGTLNLDACKPGGQWPKLEKFDLVISWWTNTHQSEYTMLTQFSSQAKTTVLNEAEIMYSLRSYEKYGMLEHVNQVFILIDQDVLSHYGAPRFFDYSNTKIKVISSEDLGLNRGGKWEKLTRMHTIHGLSDYFLWLPDDNFMMRQFNMNVLWSEDKRAPKLHEFGTWAPGWCDNQASTGSLHGPVLLQKCAVATVMDRYFGASQQHVILDAMKTNQPIDTLCLFTRAVSQEWENVGFDTSFHEECHTNGN